MDAIALSQELRIASQIENPVDRVMEIMAVLTEAFASVGHTTPVLVGGGAVDYYTGGKFGSRDIDALLYTPSKVVDRVMLALGFLKVESRYWYLEAFQILLEFPGSPDEPNLYTTVTVRGRPVRIERLESAILTRLNYFAMGSMADGMGALFLVLADQGRIDWSFMEDLAKREQVDRLLEGIRHMARSVDWTNPPSRESLEDQLFCLKNPGYAPIMGDAEE